MATKVTRPTIEEILKPTTMTCGGCGGTLHIIPYKVDLGKNRFRIETMNICGKCSFKSK